MEILLPELSAAALRSFIQEIEQRPYVSEKYDFDYSENNNSENNNNENNSDPNQLTVISFDYEKELQKHGRELAARLAVNRGLPPGVGEKIGKLVGGRRKTRRLRHRK